jgi:hypothetical protein
MHYSRNSSLRVARAVKAYECAWWWNFLGMQDFIRQEHHMG